FSNWLPQKKEEFESPQVEVETPSSVLPHRGRGPIVVANQDDRIHWLEPALQDTEEPETDRRVTASAVLIRDDPTENPSGTEDPMRFQRDLFHLIVETCLAARDSTKSATQPAGVTPLNDASPASGWPAACDGKSHDVSAYRSVRPSISHASAGTTDCAGEAVSAMGEWYTAGPYERPPQREICESENLPGEG